MDTQTLSPGAVIDRLAAVTAAHDLEALVGCFATDYVNETPAHPARGFTGREQVRRNWSQLFAAIPDLRTEVVARAVDGDTVWTEWDMQGTRRDGATTHLRGVMVFRVGDGLIRSVRFYLEPVDPASSTMDDNVAVITGAGAS